MADNAECSSPGADRESDAEIVDADGAGGDLFSASKPLETPPKPLEPSSDAFSEPSADVSKKTFADFPNKLLADIFSEPLVDTTSKPLADISSEPPADIKSELLADILSEPLADIFSEQPVNISSKPLADTSSELLADILSEQPVVISSEPLAEISSALLADISSEPLADISSEPLADVSSAPLADIPSEPLADIPSEPLADISSVPLKDILSEPPADISSELLADILNEPLADISSEPPVDIFSKPLDDSSSESLDDISSEPPADISSEPLAEILSEPPVEIFSESLGDTASEPLPDISSEAPADISSESLNDTSSDPFVDILSDPPVDISSELLADVLSEPSVDIYGEPLDDAAVELPDICGEPPVNTSNELLAEATCDQQESGPSDPTVDITSEPIADICNEIPGDIVSKQPDEIINEPQVDISSKVLADISSEEPADTTSEPQVDVSNEPLTDICIEPLADTSSKTPADIPSGAPPDVFTDPLTDISEHVPDKPESPAVTSSGPMLNILSETPNDIFSEPGADILSEAPVDIFSEEGVATNSLPSIASQAFSRQAEGEVQNILAEATVELSLGSKHEDEEETTIPSLMPDPISGMAATAEPEPAITEEEEESRDVFDINVSVTSPEKVGDGMHAYMAYTVSTQTTLAMFHSHAFTVKRRFSDFMTLYEKLTDKHSQKGYIVPPPPEKSIMGMTKVKVGREDSSSAEFVEKRRAALERYLQRVVSHPSLIQDPDVLDFLEKDELPRTDARIGAGFFKMISQATEAISRMTIKMNESDAWFEQKLHQIESEDLQLRKLHAVIGSMITHRKELSGSTAQFAKSMAILGNSEDNMGLSRALSQLAELDARIEQLQQDRASSDYFILAELLTDYIRLLGVLRGCFDQRIRAWQRWQDAQNTLQKQREMEAKLLWANKPDQLQLAKDRIAEWESKVSQYEREFERISATLRSEVLRFEKEKANDFKIQIVRYLESLLQSEQQLMKYWEVFLPEAKAIA